MTIMAPAKFRMAAIIAGSMLVGSVMTGTAFAYQGHMLNALRALQSARSQLAVSRPDGGYRDHALGLVDAAINTVNQSIHAAY